jgi:hypothetical protein
MMYVFFLLRVLRPDCFQLNLTSHIFGGGYILKIFDPVSHNLDKSELDYYTEKNKIKFSSFIRKFR